MIGVMSGKRDTVGRAGRWWRGLAVAGLAPLMVSVIPGLMWFLSDPQPESRAWSEALSWRASVVGMLVGVAALVVSVLALRDQKRAARRAAPADPSCGGPESGSSGHAGPSPASWGPVRPPRGEAGTAENPPPRTTVTPEEEPVGPVAPSHRSQRGGHVNNGIYAPVINNVNNFNSPKAPLWWRGFLYLATATFMASVFSVAYPLVASPSSGQKTNPAAVSRASPVSAPPEMKPGYGFRTRIEFMAFRISSSWWTQTVDGAVEYWSRNTCPPGTVAYWVALLPSHETVQFTCDSWQYHKWTGILPGTYHLEIWKEYDGQAVRGSGVVRSSVPVMVHPKPSPTPSAA